MRRQIFQIWSMQKIVQPPSVDGWKVSDELAKTFSKVSLIPSFLHDFLYSFFFLCARVGEIKTQYVPCKKYNANC